MQSTVLYFVFLKHRKVKIIMCSAALGLVQCFYSFTGGHGGKERQGNGTGDRGQVTGNGGKGSGGKE